MYHKDKCKCIHFLVGETVVVGFFEKFEAVKEVVVKKAREASDKYRTLQTEAERLSVAEAIGSNNEQRVEVYKILEAGMRLERLTQLLVLLQNRNIQSQPFETLYRLFEQELFLLLKSDSSLQFASDIMDDLQAQKEKWLLDHRTKLTSATPLATE